MAKLFTSDKKPFYSEAFFQTETARRSLDELTREQLELLCAEFQKEMISKIFDHGGTSEEDYSDIIDYK